MVSSISSSDDDVQQMMALMLQSMNAADTDGTSGLSKSELSSINAGDDAGGSAFLKSLTDQFDSLDADKNGQLSSEEISDAKPPTEAMGPPPGMAIGSSDNDDASSFVSDLLDAMDSSDATDETASSSSSTDTSNSASTLSDAIEQLISSLLESFSEGFDKDSESTRDNSVAQDVVKSVTSAIDADGDGAVTFEELSSANSSDISDLSSDLSKNFENYDANSDGKLSAEEMTAAMEKQSNQFSMNELASMGSNDSLKSFGSFLGSSSSLFVQKLISDYQNGGLSNLTSSLSLIS